MANSFNEYNGDGVTTEWAITFSFITRAHVSVFVDGVSAQFTWVSDSLIQLSPAVASGSFLRIVRSSSVDEQLVTFEDGTLSEEDLNTAVDQNFYVAQEAIDIAASAMTQDPGTGQFDASNKRVSNVSDGVADSDVATVGQTVGIATEAQVSADASAASASESAASAASSEASATDAATSETNAAASAAAAAIQNLPTPVTGDEGRAVRVKDDLTGFDLLTLPQPLVRSFTGSGTVGPFDLATDPGASANVQVTIDGVAQHATEWSISGTNLTFTEVVYSGAAIEVHVNGQAAETTVPADGSVNEPKLANNAVTTAKIPDGAVTPEKRTHQFFIAREQYDTVQALPAVAGDNIRALNTKVLDDFGTAALSASGQISGLPSGRYRVSGYGSKYAQNHVHQVYLFNVTDGQIVIPGHAGYAGTSSGTDSVPIPMSGIIDIGDGKTFEFRQWSSGAYANGLGYFPGKRADLDLVLAEIVFERIGA